MDHENTIPSPLSPATTIPAVLGAAAPAAPASGEGSSLAGLAVKLLLLAAAVGLTLYFSR